MIEIFETCQTKSIAKQTNRDESLIIRSIGQIDKMQLYTFIFFRLCSFWGLSRFLCVIISILLIHQTLIQSKICGPALKELKSDLRRRKAEGRIVFM